MSAAQRRIVLFFLLALPLTWWGFALVWFDPSQEWARNNFALGPLIAAPIAIWFDGGRAALLSWLRRLGNFRAPPWVYAVSFFVPLALGALSLVFALASGAAPGTVPAFGFDALAIYGVVVLVMGPLPEEVTFRGLGQHELQEEMSAFAASAWIGLGVLVWHLPLFVSGELPWQIGIAIMAVSVVYAWLYNAGGSVWPLVILHFVVNYFGANFFQDMLAPGGNLLRDVPDGLLCRLGRSALLVVRPAIGASAAPCLTRRRLRERHPVGNACCPPCLRQKGNPGVSAGVLSFQRVLTGRLRSPCRPCRRPCRRRRAWPEPCPWASRRSSLPW
jgi:membrane protease YdiL (CAAX protease family)